MGNLPWSISHLYAIILKIPLITSNKIQRETYIWLLKSHMVICIILDTN